MDKEPDEPRRKARNVEAEDIGNGCGAANDGHVAFVEVPEGAWGRTTFDARANHFRGVAAALNGSLRDTRQRLVLFVACKREVTGNKDIRKIRNGEIGIHADLADAVGLGAGALRDDATETGGDDPASPENVFGVHAFDLVALFVLNSVGVDASDEGVFVDFDTEVRDQFFSLRRKVFGIDTQYPRRTFEENDAGF